MTWAADEGRAAQRARRAGFTLLEILLCIAIIAALAGVLVTGAFRLTEHKDLSPDEIFWKAVMETRKKALLSGADQQLRITGRARNLAIEADGPGGPAMYPFNSDGSLSVDFLGMQKMASAIMIAGQAIDTGTVPYVTLYSDGTCTPFRVQFHAGASPAHTISIDPWTCAPVFTTDDNRR